MGKIPRIPSQIKRDILMAMINKPFQYIALIGRARKNLGDTLDAVADYLLARNISLCVEENTAEIMTKNNLPTFSENNIPTGVDLMIVVGGDGSLLNAAHCALPYHLPVLGINRGHLGFLADIYPNELSLIDDVLAGQYTIEERFVLTVNNKKSLGIALNDAVLLPGDTAHLIEFEITINNQFMCHQRADGLIIATPTGSTAYALSGGGPILHPPLNAIVIVPMFPHKLSSRPIVIDGNAKIDLRISTNNETSPYFSCDGLRREKITPGDLISITKNKTTLKLVHPLNYDYFATLREKLGWESQG